MILSAQTIRARCVANRSNEYPLVTPFHERAQAHGMTFGLSGCGYDVRIAETLSIEPGGCALASTIEQFFIPVDIMGTVADKSTWAREFLAVQHTIIEPGWYGHLTLELTNHSAKVINIEAGMPIAQIIFMRLDKPTDQPYKGKYQNQEAGPQVARYTTIADDNTPVEYVVSAPGRKTYRVTGDENEGNIFIGNERIGYTENGNLYLIGADTYAHKIASIDDMADVFNLVQQHYNSINER